MNIFLKLLCPLLPIRILDDLVNSSLPTSGRTIKILSRTDPWLFEYLSDKKLMYLFKKASGSVPAYRKFLEQHKISPRDVKNPADYARFVPQTSKENYVHAFPLAERCVDGELPRTGYLEESAGTSGVPTHWIKSREEEAEILPMMKATMKYLYNFCRNERFVILNCLMMGGWTGGLRFASRIDGMGIVRNVGPDAPKIVSCMKEFGPGYTYFISGYPPFITELIEYGNKTADFSWKDYKIHILTGGEGFVEEWRDYISGHLRDGVKIFSDYGAIDIDVGISTETPFTVAIRKLIKTDTALREEILSSGRLPSFIGQYSPQRFYIRETISPAHSKELEITVLNLKSCLPKLKYVIGDEGGIIRFQRLCEILDRRGYSTDKLRIDFNLPPVIPFPLIWIYGRTDGTVSINGALISPDEIYAAILSDSELVSAIHTFKLSVVSEPGNFIRLCIFLEARKHIVISNELITRCRHVIVSKLTESNECFRSSYLKDPGAAGPVVEVIPYQTGVFVNDGDTLKNIYS